ncbi:MAG TPA: hypothetical protein VLM89_12695 [Phycisphaerae bacterium]|nr:hypothetical protein [Phycisphaerae bacterium]
MKTRAAVILFVLFSAFAQIAWAQTPAPTSAEYRPDVQYPEYMPLWREGWQWTDENGDRVRYAYEGMPLGGYLFATFRNTGSEALEVKDVLMQGVSLADAVAFESQAKVPGMEAIPASIKFSKLPAEQIDKLVEAGEPVWWKVEPTLIPPGGMGEVTIRLRRDPKVESIRLSVPVAQNKTEATEFQVARRQPRFFSINFSPSLDEVYAYLRHQSGKGIAPKRILIDDLDVTERSRILADEAVDTVPVIIKMDRPFEEGSYHFFTAEYEDGSIAQACLGAWQVGLVYGMWGCTQGKDPEQTARTYITDLAAHNVNVFMIHCGGVANEYLHTPEGQQLLESHGIRRMMTWPSRDRDAIFYFLIDEPDAADFTSKMLDPYKRIGSRAQYLVDRCKLFRRHDPKNRPILLNINNTFKPENWYTYAQLTDIPCADPYYQEGVQSVWACDPTNMGAYLKPTYVYAVGEIYQSAGAPNPMHLILHTCRFDFKPEESPYRAPTPEEKRIEVYYSLAAGAKQLSYWWYSATDNYPDSRYYGVGGSAPEMKALWKEIGLVGAEVRTLAEQVTLGCPAGLSIKGPRMIWARSLLAGEDTVVILVVNDNMASDRVGTVIRPIDNAKLTVQTPAWLKPAAAFEITCEGTRDVSWQAADGGVRFDLGTVNVTRLLVITKDTGLRDRLQHLYQKDFAANVQKLLAQSAAPTK